MERVKGITGKSVKEFLSNNAIAIMIVVMALYVGFTKDNFFTFGNIVIFRLTSKPLINLCFCLRTLYNI